ncbi:hypothetical protein BDN72DRAFT_325645 [Pluteus cervinus]|uniref:Uncharacterized protein n=1 Tax=Pluteus cervinus TaxID=181527 RepID=A0ACD3B3I7_9AGAR|nr:hypothetical protein BDN72DRAFT_325645 [Pluteus cervinus]
MISHTINWPGSQPTMTENPQPSPHPPQPPTPSQQQVQHILPQQLEPPRASRTIHNSASLLIQLFEEEKAKAIHPYQQRIQELEASLNEFQLRLRLGSVGNGSNSPGVPASTTPAGSPGIGPSDSGAQNPVSRAHYSQSRASQLQSTPPQGPSQNVALTSTLLLSSGLEYQAARGTLRYHGPWAELAQQVVMETRPGISPDELDSFMEPSAFGAVLGEYLDSTRLMREQTETRLRELEGDRDGWKEKFEQVMMAVNEASRNQGFQEVEVQPELQSENPANNGEFQPDELMSTMMNLS